MTEEQTILVIAAMSMHSAAFKAESEAHHKERESYDNTRLSILKGHLIELANEDEGRSRQAQGYAVGFFNCLMNQQAIGESGASTHKLEADKRAYHAKIKVKQLGLLIDCAEFGEADKGKSILRLDRQPLEKVQATWEDVAGKWDRVADAWHIISETGA